jgi:hypothetical protein
MIRRAFASHAWLTGTRPLPQRTHLPLLPWTPSSSLYPTSFKGLAWRGPVFAFCNDNNNKKPQNEKNEKDKKEEKRDDKEEDPKDEKKEPTWR